MNIETFKSHIKTVSHETLDSYFDQITAKMARARKPEYRLGYAAALDALSFESGMRLYPIDSKTANMTDDELAAELGI